MMRFNFIKLTMGQFCKMKRGERPHEVAKIDASVGKNTEQPFLLNFLERQSLKSHINKCGPINHRSNKMSFLRTNKPLQINFGITNLPFKFSSRTRQQQRFDHEHLEPAITKNIHNSKGFDKQNRPASTNELKHRPLGKIKAQFCNTQRYESLHSLALQERPSQEHQEAKIKKINIKNNKYKITKSQSRSHLSKIIMKEPKNLTEAEQLNQNDIRIRKSHGQKTNQKLVEQKVQAKNFKDNFHRDLKTSLGNQTLENFQTIIIKPPQAIANEQNIQSSFIEDLFDIDFSTIKLRDQNSSKFISQQIMQELIDPINSSRFQNESKGHCHKKRKIDIDKIRKKFPEHFFK